MEPITVTIVGGLVVAAASGIAKLAYEYGRSKEKNIYERVGITDAEEYANSLGNLIREANRFDPKDYRKLEDKVRTLVSLRDEYRNALAALGELLNSHIDELNGILNEYRSINNEHVANLIRRKLDELNSIWPEKSRMIERRFLTIIQQGKMRKK